LLLSAAIVFSASIYVGAINVDDDTGLVITQWSLIFAGYIVVFAVLFLP
jgi:hypothetical protein